MIMSRLPVMIVLTVLAFAAFSPSLSSGSHPVASADADLNGDGKMERISVSVISEGQYNFILRINENSVKGRLFAGLADGLIVLDIDTTDGYQEIAVHTPGPSCDDEYLIFGYAGDTVKQMGRLSRWPSFPGDGIVLVDQWMGFWRKKDKYVLNQQTRTLDLVPQEFYHVGIEAIVREVFSVCRTREDPTIVADLDPQSKVIVLLCDPSPTHCKDVECRGFEDFYCDWYCIKSEEGIIGWARLGVFWDKLGLDWAD
jgi:hypothetical protein